MKAQRERMKLVEVTRRERQKGNQGGGIIVAMGGESFNKKMTRKKDQVNEKKFSIRSGIREFLIPLEGVVYLE